MNGKVAKNNIFIARSAFRSTRQSHDIGCEVQLRAQFRIQMEFGNEHQNKPESSFSVCKSRKGRLIVARQFSGGKRYPASRTRPVGTLEFLSQRYHIQPSLRDEWGVSAFPPTTELAGYYQSSLTGLKQTNCCQSSLPELNCHAFFFCQLMHDTPINGIVIC